MAPVDDNDSGMESQDGSEKQEETTSKDSKEKKQLEIEDNEEDEV